MAKTSVLARPLPNSSLPRNTFSRDFFTRLNWSAGMLVPVFCKDVPEGTSGEINRSVFMRTNAVNTAAFPKLDTHIDFYKVPKKFLMSRYEEWKVNIDDVNSTSLYDTVGGSTQTYPPTSRVPLSLPYIELQDVVSGIAQTWTDDLGYSWASGAKRLMDLLGYNDFFAGLPAAQLGTLANMRLNTLRIQAYQKVYFDHYRNSAYESNNPFAYNADILYTNSYGGNWAYGSVQNLFKLRYVNYRKDFFMNIYPALNYVVSTPSGSDWSIPSDTAGNALGGDRLFGVNKVYLGADSVPSLSQRSSLIASNSQGITPQAIRALFALDRLMRLSAYTPKHVKDQIEARFGVKKPNVTTFESTYLGSFKNDVVIGEVTSTADTQNSSGGLALGAIGGRGVGAQGFGDSIHFEVTGADGDCIIIGMMYTLARSAYDSWRLDAHNFKFLREDVFQPEFMDLGLRPITVKEMFMPYGTIPTLAQLNTILGYVPRDQEYKLEVDENHGEFRSSGSLQAFVNHTNVSVYQRGQTPGTPGVTFAFFKIAPSDLDSIFMQSYDSTHAPTDQFFGEFTFKFICRQNMSVHGQPRL